MKQKISITISEKTLKDIDSIVDNIFIQNRSQAIEHLANLALGENKAAVILAGGNAEGLRIGKDEYRSTAKINGSSVCELAVKKLRENNFKTIYIVAEHKVLTAIFDILNDGSSYGVKINYIEDKENKGTASSLKLLRGRINSNFIVIYGDIVFSRINIEELWKQHLMTKAIATLMLTTSPTPSRKGIVKIEGSKILAFEQKPTKTDIYLGFSSIFIADPQILNYEGDSLEYDVFPQLAEKGLLSGHLSSEKEIHIHSKEDVKSL
jgi:NDP-sugar pyrophosphorylase family protein